jgi:tRNA pseudouridine38-40 synthase
VTRYKIEIEYDGTNYFGWQKQKDKPSIQEVIENSLFKIFKKNIEIFGSGRTDAGVHAFGQVAHFDIEQGDSKLEPFQMMMAINHNIDRGQDVVITNCETTSDAFHSRFDAKMRFYKYLICNRVSPLALNKRRMWHVPQKLDLKKMQEACKYLIGKHDFSSFRDSEAKDKNPIRTINDIKIKKLDDVITVDISAKSFLHHMVRNIVGTLYLVGKNKVAIDDVGNILIAKDRTKSGPNAPAYGLYFLKVEY